MKLLIKINDETEYDGDNDNDNDNGSDQFLLGMKDDIC